MPIGYSVCSQTLVRLRRSAIKPMTADPTAIKVEGSGTFGIAATTSLAEDEPVMVWSETSRPVGGTSIPSVVGLST